MAVPLEITKRHVEMALMGVWSQAREAKVTTGLKRAAELLQAAQEELAKLPPPVRATDEAQPSL